MKEHLSYADAGRPQTEKLANGTVVQVHRVIPEDKKTEVPVLFSHGFGQGGTVLPETLNLFANTGREVLGIDTRHIRKRWGWETHVTESDEKVALTNLQASKADAMKEVIDRLNIEKVDLVGTSEGALRTMIFALKYPERVRSVVLVHPGGMSKFDLWLPLGIRTVYQGGKEALHHVRERSSKKKKEKDKKTLKNKGVIFTALHPKRALRESASVAYSRLYKLLPELKMPVSLVIGKKDIIFPRERLLKGIAPEHLYTVRESDGGHGIGRRQEVVDLVDRLLTDMGAESAQEKTVFPS